MSLAAFTWTNRVRPVVEMGIGDSRVASPGGVWDEARWDQAGAVWAGVEPTWIDVTCDTRSYRCEYGRRRSTERFVPGVATVVVDNSSGWADISAAPLPNTLTVRPGRAIRLGVVHEVYGTRWLFRGFVDEMNPTYHPTDTDTVTLSCVDALGEVNRAKLVPVDPPVGAGQTVTDRIAGLLDRALWPASKRDLAPTSDTLIADALGGQLADLLGQAADSGGGSVYGDTNGDVVYRARDWQTYVPGTPVDGTIGNVEASDVCPVQWERPFARADMATRVIIGRDLATAQQFDDPEGQRRYGIEPFERTDLLTESDTRIAYLGKRLLRTRSAASSPRIRSVTLDARTATNALDLMTTVDVFLPSRYRCRLQYPRGTVFDVQHFATGVVHEVTPKAWTLDLNLDVAAPYAALGAGWDVARWDQSVWTDAAAALGDLRSALERMSA